MTKTLRLLIILIIICGLYSCDRFGYYKYEITNTSDKSIEFNFTTLYDSTGTITVDPKTTIEFYRDRTGTLGKNEKPHDIYDKDDLMGDFKSISVFVDSKTINKDFRIRNEWTYKAIDRQFGVYSLTIDSIEVKN